MPTYDWKCSNCDQIFEAVSSMSDCNDPCDCPYCYGVAVRIFSPNRNILIPGYFRMDRGWHLPPGGSEGSSPDVNNRVHTPTRTSFKQQFESNWKQAGGG